MTTQHTHPEQSDGDSPVVEHVPVPETESTSKTGIPTPTVGEHHVSSRTPEGPLTDAFVPEEPVQPFSEFIKEFRQTETRFNSSKPEHHGGTQFMVPGPGTTPVEASTTTHQATDVEAQSASSADASLQDGNTSKNEDSPAVPAPAARPVSPLLRPATRQRMPRYSSGRRREEPAPASAEPVSAKPSSGDATPASAETSTTLTPEPAISEQTAPVHEAPRPARRYRFDRPSASATVTPAAPAPAPVAPRVEEGKETVARNVSTLPTHPAAPWAQVLSAQEPVVESSEVAATPATPTTPALPTQVAPEHDRRRRYGQEKKQQRGKGQTTTPATQATQATPAASTPAQSIPPVQVVAPMIEEVVAALLEPVTTPSEEISPEDLPPLEYAELQKANSRRRRRRHTNGSPTSVAIPAPVRGKAGVGVIASATVPELPVVSPSAVVQTVTPPSLPPVSMPSMSPMPRPSAPVAPAPAGQQYGITSGYTVSQMNQNGESSNAFMGPEPSPARGSIAAQNVRSIRTDVQRTPAYPVRTTEATSASVHQLASVVAQAVQTQTDRMIAELRRANQTPTNISVSLPPFPSNERVGVFVDVANLLYSARTLRMNVDFGKLLDFLRGNRRLIRAQAYCPTSPQPGDEQMFLQAVKGLGYRITTKNYKTFSSGAKKADLDLDLCMDVVRLVDGKAVDCIVLVSGDSDFMPMLDYCSDHGVRVEVAAFDEAMSATLRQGCDLFINLSMLEEIRV